jgi:hypothetical protein
LRDSGIGAGHQSGRSMAMIGDGIDSERRNHMNGIISELAMKLREPADDEAGEQTQRRS